MGKIGPLMRLIFKTKNPKIISHLLSFPRSPKIIREPSDKIQQVGNNKFDNFSNFDQNRNIISRNAPGALIYIYLH